LRQIQDPEGCFGPRTEHHFTYNHAVCTQAMVEAFALTDSPLLRPSAEAGIRFALKAQNPYLAWRYGVRPDENDTSVTAWMVSALFAGKAAGLTVPEESFAGARAWIDKVTERKGGRVGYTKPGNGPARKESMMEKFNPELSEAMTAAGLFVRHLAGDRRSGPLTRKGVGLCLKTLPIWNERSGAIDMYYWYYGTEALHQVGGKAWRTWSGAVEKALVDHQQKTGHAKGSWDPVDPWGPDGGRVYSTAICTLALETPHRHGRLR
jgi:hypothetical protein